MNSHLGERLGLVLLYEQGQTKAPLCGNKLCGKHVEMHIELPRNHCSNNGSHLGFQTTNPQLEPYITQWKCQCVSIPHVVRTQQAAERATYPHQCPTCPEGFILTDAQRCFTIEPRFVYPWMGIPI